MTPVLTTLYVQFIPTSLSIEAFASALFPLDVAHQTDDDEEDAAQHGEEHSEENGHGAHPLFSWNH